MASDADEYARGGQEILLMSCNFLLCEHVEKHSILGLGTEYAPRGSCSTGVAAVGRPYTSWRRGKVRKGEG